MSFPTDADPGSNRRFEADTEAQSRTREASEGSGDPLPARLVSGTLQLNGRTMLPWLDGTRLQYHAIALQAGVAVDFSLQELNGSSAPDFWIVDRFGQRLTGTSVHVNSADRLTFTPTATGMYYVALDPDRTVGPAALSAVTSTDLPATSQTQATLYTNLTVNSVFNTSGDSDWMRLRVSPGESVAFSLGFFSPPTDLSGADLYAGLQTPAQLTIVRADGSIVSNTPVVSGSFNQFTYNFGQLPAGDYFVSVSHPSAAQFPYSITRASGLNDVPSGTSATASLIVNGPAVTGFLQGTSAPDTDGYRFTASAGETIIFDVNDELSDFSSPHALAVVDLGGTVLAGTLSSPAVARSLTFVAPQSGTYVLDVQGPSGYDNFPYRITARTPGDDYAADSSTTATMGNGTILNLRADSSADRDWVAVDLVAGQRVEFSGVNLGGPNDPRISAVSGGGSPIAGGQGGSNFLADGVLRYSAVYAAQVTGRYFFEFDYSETGSLYTISSRIWTDDHRGLASVLSPVMVSASGSSISGILETSNDEDVFGVTLGDDQGILIRLVNEQGQPFGDLTLMPPSEVSYPGPYLLVDTVPLFGRAPALVGGSSTGSAGVWNIMVTGETAGRYTMTVTPVADDYRTGAGQFGQIRIGGAVTGQSTFTNDTDRFAVTVAAGDVLRFDLSVSEPGFATLRVVDTNGNEVTEALQTDWSRLIDRDQSLAHAGETEVYRFASSGTYYVEVIGTAGFAGGIIPTDYTITTTALANLPIPAAQAWMFTPGAALLTAFGFTGPAPAVAEIAATIQLAWYDSTSVLRDVSRVVAPGEALFSSNIQPFGSHTPIVYSNAYADLTNQGTLWAESLSGGTTAEGNYNRLTNNASIISLAADGSSRALGGSAYEFYNSGLIAALAGGIGGAVAVSVRVNPNPVGNTFAPAVNDGDIYAQSALGRATGFIVDTSGQPALINHGDIFASGYDQATGVQLGFRNVLTNTGTIAAETTALALSTAQLSVGVFASSGLGQVNNSGVISAEIAIRASDQFRLNNTGQIEGMIVATSLDNEVGGTGHEIINSGLITGHVLLSARNDVYDGRSGRLNGTLYLDAGNDTARGGAFGDRFHGEAGNDQLYGNGGSDLLFGGAGNDWIDGGAGSNKLFGEAGADTLVASDNDQLTGGEGQDRFIMTSGARAITITDFETGTDTIGFQSNTGISSLAGLSFSEDSRGVTIVYGATTIFVRGVTLEMLMSSQFVFNSSPQPFVPPAEKSGSAPVSEIGGLDPDQAGQAGDLGAASLLERLESLGLSLSSLQTDPARHFDFRSLDLLTGAPPGIDADFLAPRGPPIADTAGADMARAEVLDWGMLWRYGHFDDAFT